MFEKEAEEYSNNWKINKNAKLNFAELVELRTVIYEAHKDGAEFGYNKVNEELRLKLKDEGIVKPLKDSILQNERLSSQEQQELCAWIECAMDFGENLDECAKELEEANKANEWHYVEDGDLPKDEEWKWCVSYRGYYYVAKYEEMFGCWTNQEYSEVMQPYAWKEIVLPKESE